MIDPNVTRNKAVSLDLKGYSPESFCMPETQRVLIFLLENHDDLEGKIQNAVNAIKLIDTLDISLFLTETPCEALHDDRAKVAERRTVNVRDWVELQSTIEHYAADSPNYCLFNVSNAVHFIRPTVQIKDVECTELRQRVQELRNQLLERQNGFIDSSAEMSSFFDAHSIHREREQKMVENLIRYWDECCPNSQFVLLNCGAMHGPPIAQLAAERGIGSISLFPKGQSNDLTSLFGG